MPTIDVVTTLRHAFPDLDDDAVERLAGLVRTATYPADTLICKDGAHEEVFYLIVSGKVAITKHFEGAEERVLRHSGAGDFFGEMALIQEQPRSANVRTTQRTTLLEFDREVFEHLMASSPDLAWRMVRITFDRLRHNDQTALADLREAYHTLAQLDKAKLDFIEVAAHELRTPLTVIHGYADVLRSHSSVAEDASLAEVIDGIVRGTSRLYEIVNGMLDITKIDTETLRVSRVPVLIQSVLSELRSEFASVLESRDLTFEIRRIGDVPYIEADPGLMYKIFYQLYTNAIKYTPDGGTITTTYWITDVEDMGRTLAIVVEDNGVGIDPEYHQLIFEKFYRLGDAALHSSGKTSFKGGGPGLGLALVKGAVEAHGGLVWVESEGCDEARRPGSAFKLLLPVHAIAADGAQFVSRSRTPS